MIRAARLARRAAPTLLSPSAGAYIGTRALATRAGKPQAAKAAAPSASGSAPTPRPSPASPASEQPPADNISDSAASSTPPKEESSAVEDVTPPPTLRSLDFTSTLTDAALPAPEGSTPDAAAAGRTGARSARNSKSTSERRRGGMARLALGVFAVGASWMTYDLGSEWTVDEVKAKKWTDDQVPLTRWARTKTRFQDLFNVFSEPQWEELLPPPQPDTKPLTLVVCLDDLLVTSTWDRQNGWRTAKRPGVDYFLAYLSQFYEVVVWTTQHNYTAQPILDKLDPYRFFIAYQLFRESTRASANGVVKDLAYLNRDLRKVVVLETDPDVVRTHAANALVLPKWDGARGDRGLVALIPFLESIGIYNPEDVRPILQAYAGKDIPVEYAKTEAAAKAAHIEQHRAKGAPGRGLGGVTLTGMFASPTQGGAGGVPPTYLEAKRAEAQMLYRREQAYIAEHKAEFDALLEADRQAAMREGPGSLFGYMQAIGGGAPPSGADAGASTAGTAAEMQVPLASK